MPAHRHDAGLGRADPARREDVPPADAGSTDELFGGSVAPISHRRRGSSRRDEVPAKPDSFGARADGAQWSDPTTPLPPAGTYQFADQPDSPGWGADPDRRPWRDESAPPPWREDSAGWPMIDAGDGDPWPSAPVSPGRGGEPGWAAQPVSGARPVSPAAGVYPVSPAPGVRPASPAWGEDASIFGEPEPSWPPAVAAVPSWAANTPPATPAHRAPPPATWPPAPPVSAAPASPAPDNAPVSPAAAERAAATWRGGLGWAADPPKHLPRPEPMATTGEHPGFGDLRDLTADDARLAGAADPSALSYQLRVGTDLLGESDLRGASTLSRDSGLSFESALDRAAEDTWPVASVYAAQQFGELTGDGLDDRTVPITHRKQEPVRKTTVRVLAAVLVAGTGIGVALNLTEASTSVQAAPPRAQDDASRDYPRPAPTPTQTASVPAPPVDTTPAPPAQVAAGSADRQTGSSRTNTAARTSGTTSGNLAPATTVTTTPPPTTPPTTTPPTTPPATTDPTTPPTSSSAPGSIDSTSTPAGTSPPATTSTPAS